MGKFKIIKYIFTTDHTIFRLSDDEAVDIFENEEIIIIQEPNITNEYEWVFLYKGDIYYQHNYSIEDLIERCD